MTLLAGSIYKNISRVLHMVYISLYQVNFISCPNLFGYKSKMEIARALKLSHYNLLDWNIFRLLKDFSNIFYNLSFIEIIKTWLIHCVSYKQPILCLLLASLLSTTVNSKTVKANFLLMIYFYKKYYRKNVFIV